MSSGAIAAGLALLALARRPGPRRPAGGRLGRAGAAGAPLHRGAGRHGLVTGQVLLTLDDVTRRAHYRNAYQTFAKLLELGVLPIVNENDTVATTEIRFGDNDRLAALVAHLVHADLLVLLSDVDGLYDADPSAPGSSLLTDVTSEADLAQVRIGRAGPAGWGPAAGHTAVQAARIATGAGIPSSSPPPSRPPPRSPGSRSGPLPRHRQAPPDPPAVAGARHRAQGTLVLDLGRCVPWCTAGRPARRRPHRGDRPVRRR